MSAIQKYIILRLQKTTWRKIENISSQYLVTVIVEIFLSVFYLKHLGCLHDCKNRAAGGEYKKKKKKNGLKVSDRKDGSSRRKNVFKNYKDFLCIQSIGSYLSSGCYNKIL